MIQEQLEYAANVLLGSRQLTGGDSPKLLPKIFIVDGKCYYYFNAAKRAAYGTVHPIYVMSIEDAWEIYTHLDRDTLSKEAVAWEFDQTGATFDGNLFCDNVKVRAYETQNKVIPINYQRKT